MKSTKYHGRSQMTCLYSVHNHRLIGEGLLLHDKTKMRERKLRALNQEYVKAQETAKEQRLNLWRYGDFTEDDAKEFGVGGRR